MYSLFSYQILFRFFFQLLVTEEEMNPVSESMMPVFIRWEPGAETQ